MPKGVYARHKEGPVRRTIPDAAPEKSISIVRSEAAKSRWEAVKEERESYLAPFYELSIERAMAYLEDLRKICEQGGTILNDRIGNDKDRMRCAGPRCGKDLSGLRPNGMPLWIAKKDLRDRQHPEIIRSLYFCSSLCENSWARAAGGAAGGVGDSISVGAQERL